MQMESYSQYGEDAWIVQHVPLPSKGVYVDVGAADGVYLSNSYLFERMGWDGLLIEPDPRHHKRLYSQRRGQVVPYAVAKQKGFVTFGLMPEPTHSGILRASGNQIEIAAKPLSQMVQEAGIEKIHVLSIDTEGTELDVWASLDVERHAPSVVILEWETEGLPDKTEEIRTVMKSSGYVEVLKTQGNLIFLHGSDFIIEP